MCDQCLHVGSNILDTTNASPLYNDNESCVRWSHNMTTKQIWHMEMRENTMHEWVHDASIQILHVPGWINPADIFTKEMRDRAHNCCLRDSFMCPLSDFLQQSLLDVHLSHQHAEPQLQQVLSSAASLSVFSSRGSYILTLCLSPLPWTLGPISHLSIAGRHIIRLIVLVSITLDLGPHLSSIHCRTSYHPFAKSGCDISLDMSSAFWIHPGWIPFFCLGRKDGGVCLSLIRILVVCVG